MMASTREAHAIACTIAAHGMMPTSDRGHTSPSPPSADVWEHVLADLDRHRLSGLAVAAALDGSLPLKESQREELLTLHRRWLATSLVRERRTLGLVTRFLAADLDVVVLKGTTFAHRFYPDPGWRPFGDVDLLVRGHQWEQAADLLAEAGLHRTRPEPHLGFDRRFGKSALHRDDDGVEVDLHRTLVLGPFGLWIDPDGLFDRAVSVEVGGVAVPCLDATASYLHACVHASLGTRPVQLLALRDLVQIEVATGVKWADAAELVRQWQLGPVVRHALAEAASQLGHRPSAAAAELATISASRHAERALGAYTVVSRARGGVARATLAALPRLRDKAAYIRSLVSPDADFLTVREGEASWAARARRWRRAAKWVMPSDR